MLSLVVITVLCAIYALTMLYFTLGILRSQGAKDSQATPSVSVVVPLHNEENYALNTLKALSQQDYSGKWEVICVNDRSTDNTLNILNDFATQHSNFNVLSVPMDAPDLPSPKKRALETGFAIAKHEILMTMDADCIPPPGWLRLMASRFENNIAIVQGPKKNFGSNSILHSYQKLDTLGFTLIEAAGFSNKMPMVASAAALAYRKDLFYKVGGFSDLMQYMSGDDDMLVHKMIKEPVDYCYNLEPDAAVATAPVDSWKALLNQRARWSSNGTKYGNPAYTLFLTLIFCFYCWLLVGPLFSLAGLTPWSWWVGSFIVKFAVDAIMLGIGGWRLKCFKLLVWLPVVEIIQVPLIVFSVLKGLFFKNLRWE